MRHFFIYSTFMTLFSCVPWANAEFGDTLIELGCVQSVCLGSEKSALVSEFAGKIVETTVNREGETSQALKIRFSDGNSITAELDEQSKVWFIAVIDASFTTAHGISVGSSFADVKEQYPDASLSISMEEGGHLALTSDLLPGFFSFDLGDAISLGLVSSLEAEVPTENSLKTMKVMGIYLIRSQMP